ncbi:hypothetical protein BCL90_3952 [Pedobacter alluvionis]|uniref:Uncharacterized protein n=1 Tax=Pedobacter alluvionis TaxID=475253 RepID=A0A497XYI0_9SPHI|nr:hypothetical protein BCL90_3952 [Pedobacter alluvionis]
MRFVISTVVEKSMGNYLITELTDFSIPLRYSRNDAKTVNPLCILCVYFSASFVVNNNYFFALILLKNSGVKPR